MRGDKEGLRLRGFFPFDCAQGQNEREEDFLRLRVSGNTSNKRQAITYVTACLLPIVF